VTLKEEREGQGMLERARLSASKNESAFRGKGGLRTGRREDRKISRGKLTGTGEENVYTNRES